MRGDRVLSSDSVMLSQLPCRGVNTSRTRGAKRCASAGGKFERGVGMGVQIVADPRQVLGLAVARMIRDGLRCASPAPSSLLGRGALAWRSSTASGSSVTAWHRQRPTLLAETSRADAIDLSVQPAPSGPASHLSRVRARLTFHTAGRWHPQRPRRSGSEIAVQAPVRCHTYCRKHGILIGIDFDGENDSIT